MVIYIKRATVILVIMTLVVIYLTMTLYNRSTKPAFSRENSYTVIIDAGHGNPDGGATGISGIGESEINLKISQKLSAKLKEKCYNVIMTRETADGIYSEGNSIKEKKLSDMHNRERIINGSGADIFISIHMNSFSDSSVSGAQVFYSANRDESSVLAECIRLHLIPIYEKNDRILKEAPKSIYLMNKAKIPACLLECGFLSNVENEALLMSDDYQEKIAEAIASGIDDYFKGDTYEK
ncbi:MAG: N-acetylmuramoyl-L-alanine amidase [Clostridia bacterium]|nr:N-acetylmuramoyl-L-alanine amidase [Clostridia bacterium]